MITEFSKAVKIPELTILESRSGSGDLSDIRQLYWFLLYKSGLSYSNIGRLCERNHVTIRHGVRRIGQLIECGDRKVTGMYELTKHIKR